MINFFKIDGVAKNLYRLYLFSDLRRFLIAKPILFLLGRFAGLYILSREDLSTDTSKYNVLSYGSQEVIQYDEPCTLASMKQIVAKTLFSGTIEFDRPLIFEIDHAEIYGYPPLGFDKYGHLILETTPHPSDSTQAQIEYNIPLNILWTKYIPSLQSNDLDSACLLITSWTNNYWHWLIDVLMRIEGLEYYEKQRRIKPTLIVAKKMSSWQRESLAVLGYSPDRWMILDKEKIKVNKLIVPSFRRYFDGQNYHQPISPAACHWLRDKVLNNAKGLEDFQQSLSANIFISRHKAFCRRIVNEDEVIEALRSLDFVSYTLEDMTFVDQVRLFSQAQIIVSPHGAGLANLIFADDPLVIELFSPCVLPGNANLSRGLGFKYGCLSGKYPLREWRQSDGDMIINVQELLSLIKKMKQC